MESYEDMRLRMIACGLTFKSKSIAGVMRENQPYLNRLVDLYKRHRHEPGYKGSVYVFISDALAIGGIYQRNGEKVGVAQLTTVFARLRKEKNNKEKR